MKIIIATDSWEPLVNGVVTTLSMMVKMLKDDNHSVTVIHPGLYKNIDCPGYPDIKLAYGIILSYSELQDADAIHIATEGPIGLAVRNWCKKNKKKYNTSYHTNFPDYLKKYYKLPLWITYMFIRWFHKNSQMILVPTRTTKSKLEQKGFKNVLVWGRGYDPKIFHPNYSNILSSKKIKLICVSRVSEEKNLDAFCDLSHNDKYELWVVGDGPSRVRLEQKYPLVHFMGMRRGTELASYFASADVFVFPSKSDTLGVVMIESMACGTPVVAYPVEGPVDVITIGGILSDNFEKAIEDALHISKTDIEINANIHTWKVSYETFLNSLIAIYV